MDNYIINENTFAVLQKDDKVIIYDVDNYRVINKKIKRLINDNCLIYGSDYLGRKKFAQKILKIKYKVPIIISLSKNIILLQINNLRNEDCLFIVGNKVINYENKEDMLNIQFVNNKELKTNISIYRFEKLLINYLKLINYLNYQNK